MLRTTDTFAIWEDGASRIIAVGTLVRDDDPIAAGREALFVRVDDGPAAEPDPEPEAEPAKRRVGRRAPS
jgi:hypothetical protein